MKYQSLKDLLNGSSSTRSYFLSLPAELQTALHSCNEHIHTAAELHSYTAWLNHLSAAKYE